MKGKANSALLTSAVLFLIVTIFNGCTTTPDLLVHQKSVIKKGERSIIIFNIDWKERYNNTSKNEWDETLSLDLLNNEEEITKKKILDDRNKLRAPLYHLSNFRFNFVTSLGDRTITRFHKDIRGYEKIAIYHLPPGNLKLDEILIDIRKFKNGRKGKKPTRWFKYQMELPEKYGEWDLEAGKVYYLGDLSFNFNTKKFNFGIFPVEAVNQSVKLSSIRYDNSFDETVKNLKERKPWFPGAKVINLAADPKWFYKDNAQQEKQNDQEGNEPESDSENFF